MNKVITSICAVLLVAMVSAQDKPNIIMFFTDDQGTLDTKAYGSDDLYTPNMDKLAETGVLFTRA